ncbi:hypothetical protein Ancab_001254 [Ancistrocladus abbreviatus]
MSKIKLPPIQIRSSKTLEEEGEVNETRGVEECRTPTSEEHRIPVLKSPPPAPRKKRYEVSSKRRRLESDLSEVVDQLEIDEFFKSCYDQLFNLKRKRLCN